MKTTYKYPAFETRRNETSQLIFREWTNRLIDSSTPKNGNDISRSLRKILQKVMEPISPIDPILRQRSEENFKYPAFQTRRNETSQLNFREWTNRLIDSSTPKNRNDTSRILRKILQKLMEPISPIDSILRQRSEEDFKYWSYKKMTNTKNVEN